MYPVSAFPMASYHIFMTALPDTIAEKDLTWLSRPPWSASQRPRGGYPWAQVDAAPGFTSVLTGHLEQGYTNGPGLVGGLQEDTKGGPSHYYHSGQNTSLCLNNYNP